MTDLYPILFVGGIILLALLGFAAMLKAFYIKVPQGTALIVNGLGSQPKVSFTGAIVYPVIYKKEFMRIALLTLEIDRRGKDGLICKDNLRADITVAFYIKVNPEPLDVLKVAKAVGVDRASDTQAVGQLFNAKFSEALKTVGKQFEMHQLFEDRQNFRKRIVEVIGEDLNGYTLEDVAIDYLEQTPKASLDPNNIFDSEGIRKITEITATHNVITNDAERNQELAIKKKNVETREAALELDRQQADAEARQKREIETVRAREAAETMKVQQEERLKVENARIQTEEEIQVREENRLREVEVAGQNRLRAVSIEEERVKRARDLEVVARQREVDLTTIDKDKAIEEERKNIAKVISERVAVEKEVAIEEERIKEVRLVSEADRKKQVEIIDAQAAAEKNLVQQVKKAEADRDSAAFKAVEVTTMAQAELDAAAKQAEAKKRMAEGIEAEEAAMGLAEARVRQAKADATEKEGLVEAGVIAQKMKAEASGESEKGKAQAVVIAEKLLAEAKGIEEKGLAEARVIEAKAKAKEQDGLAEAKVMEEQLVAQARGEEQQAQAIEKKGLAEAKVKEELLTAEAKGEERLGIAKGVSIKEQGLAEAEVILQRFKSEAQGLADKFAVMNNMNENAREHEEFRLQLEKHLEEALAAIAASKDIAREQAEVMSTALGKSNIDIVSGDPSFFKAFAKSLTVGKAMNGFFEKNPVAQGVLESVLSKLTDTGKGSGSGGSSNDGTLN